MQGRSSRFVMMLLALAIVSFGFWSASAYELLFEAKLGFAIKVSDTELHIQIQASIIPEIEQGYYQVFPLLPDGTILPAGGYYREFTLTNVSIDSFPMTVPVFFRHIFQPKEKWLYVSLDECASLFAPDLEVLAGQSSIADGGVHDLVRGQAPGALQLEYTLDNTAGAGDLVVDDATASALSNCSGVSVDTALPLIVGEGETGRLLLSITLDDPGDFGFELGIASNDPDESSYTFQVAGWVMTPEEMALGGATQQLVATGSGGGHEAILDQGPVLDEAGNPVMAGYLPLSGVYEVGETVTGSAMVCDAAMNPLRSAWIHGRVYVVDLEERPERRHPLDHWMIRFDREAGCYALQWNTAGMKPGIYDIYLSIGSRGSGHTLRIRLDEPGA